MRQKCQLPAFVLALASAWLPNCSASGEEDGSSVRPNHVTRPEECNNGLDDNGDGRVDENCGCTPGITQRCFVGDPSRAGVGECNWGMQSCDSQGEAGLWGTCTGYGTAPTCQNSGSVLDKTEGSGASKDKKKPCTESGTHLTMGATANDVLLIVDHSGSMKDDITNHVSKWQTLIETLPPVLTDIQGRVPMGLMLFPPVDADDQMCSGTPMVNVPIALNAADQINTILGMTKPLGKTPTYAALDAATRYFQTSSDQRQHFIVLATDGAPNCNNMLDGRTCQCENPGQCSATRRDNCIDDLRTVNEIESLAQSGIPTFVIGLPGVERFAQILQRMAVAGGKPRAGDTAYYNPASRSELTDALLSILSSVECTFRLPTLPSDPSTVTVQLGGQRLAQDPERKNGWDWADGSHQEIVVYGQACDRIHGDTNTALTATYDCH